MTMADCAMGMRKSDMNGERGFVLGGEKGAGRGICFAKVHFDDGALLFALKSCLALAYLIPEVGNHHEYGEYFNQEPRR